MRCGQGLSRIDIEHRPQIVEAKSRFGDMELDTIVGANHQGAIVSVVDRATKFTWLCLVERGTAQLVSQAIFSCIGGLGKSLHTMTSDNGKEFADHKQVTEKTGGKFYFARPYHSWERGLNEHTNGLVRQYFPKGTNFRKISQA